MDSPLHVTPSDQARSAVFGALLRQARERRGLTLQEIAKQTKIPLRHLDALEHGNFDAVPEGPYRRFETRTFAQTVGLDQNVALAELDRALQPSIPEVDADPPGEAKPSHLRKWFVTVIAALAIVSCATAAAVSGFAIWTRTAPVPETPQRAAPVPPPPVVYPAATTAPAPLVAAPQQQTNETTAATAETGDQVIADNATSNGELVVTTEPAGARVTVDGVGWGITPLTIRHVSFGTKRVRVTKEGYVGEEHLVRVDEKRSQVALEITLRTTP